MLCVYVSTFFTLHPLLLLLWVLDFLNSGFSLYGYWLVIQTTKDVSLPILSASCLQKLTQTSSANCCYLKHNNGRSFSF